MFLLKSNAELPWPPFQAFSDEGRGGRKTEKAPRAILPCVVTERKNRKEGVEEKFTEKRNSSKKSGYLLGAYDVLNPVHSVLCINSFNP